MVSPKMNTFLRVTLARLPAIAGIILSFFTPAKVIPLAIVLIILSLMYVVLGLVRKHLKTAKQVITYILIAASLIFISIYSIMAGSNVGYYLLAAGFLGHTAWDIYQFIKNTVAPRWLSEFCMVYDTLIAIALITIGLTK